MKCPLHSNLKYIGIYLLKCQNKKCDHIRYISTPSNQKQTNLPWWCNK
jgi:hypothetical protein